jgi:hypothetical protein
MVRPLVATRRTSSRCRPLLLTALVAVTALPACGGSEEDDARDAVKIYVTAVADGDEKRACASLSEDSKRRFDKARTKCEDTFKNFGAFLSRAQKDKLKGIDPKVKVNGNTATANVAAQPFEGELRLKKEGGDWKVATQ